MQTLLKLRHPLPEPPIMDIAAWKQKTYHTWEGFHSLQDCVTPSEDQFLEEVKRYGDLDRIETWQNAWTTLWAKFLTDSVLDEPAFLVEFYLVQASHEDDWVEVMPLMLEKMAEIPEALDAVLDGIADIRNYGCEYGTEESAIKEFVGVVNDFLMEKQFSGFRRASELSGAVA